MAGPQKIPESRLSGTSKRNNYGEFFGAAAGSIEMTLNILQPM
jgi:hypothetical protein